MDILQVLKEETEAARKQRRRFAEEIARRNRVKNAKLATAVWLTAVALMIVADRRDPSRYSPAFR